MRLLLTVTLAFFVDARACEDALPTGAESAAPAPSPQGPHEGALVIAGGRPVELVARTDGTLEVYGMTAGPQALSPEWIVSAQVTTADGGERIASLWYRPEAMRFEGAVPGGAPAQQGAFLVGYIAEGKTNVIEGTLAQVLPPGPPVVAAVAPDSLEVEEAAAALDAGAAEAVAESEAEAVADSEAVAESDADSESDAVTEAESDAETESDAVAEAPTPNPTPAAELAAAPRTTMRASAMTERRAARGGFGSARRRNRR
jgi:hypothetical protein